MNRRRLLVTPILALIVALIAVSASAVSGQTTADTAYVTVLHRNASWQDAKDPSRSVTHGGGVYGPGISGVQTQNLDPLESATVSLDWWPQSGGRPVSMGLPSIPPLRAYNAYMPSEYKLTDGLYALIAHGDHRIAAVARTEWPQSGGAVLFSSSEPSRQVIVPLITCKYAGQTAYVSIQNTDETAPTTVTTRFFELGRNTPLEVLDRTITPGTSITFSACRPDGLDRPYVGYLTAEASVPLTAQAFVNVETSSKAVYAYEGVPLEAAADRLYVPLFRNNFYGTTGISVVNPGASAAQVTVRFVGALGNCNGQRYSQGPIALAPGSSAVFYQGNLAVPGTGVSPLPTSCAGSATIEATGGRVVAVVNDAGGPAAAPTSAAAYVAVSAAQAGRQIALPLYRNRHTRAQLTTGIQAINVGDAPARASIQFSLSDGTEIGGGRCGASCQVTIQPGAAANWYPPMIVGLPSNQYGSAFIDSDQPLAVIVNDTSLTGGMDAAIYTGLRADPPAP